MEVIKMSKKDNKKSKMNKTNHSNNMECNCNEHQDSFDHECSKDNCTCTKHDNSSSLTQGE